MAINGWGDCKCLYRLVMPLREHDIRRNLGDGRSRRSMRLSLGGTKVSRGNGRSPLDRMTDTIDTPYRDGAHIKWDAALLKLPAFVVCEGRAMAIEPEAQREQGNG